MAEISAKGQARLLLQSLDYDLRSPAAALCGERVHPAGVLLQGEVSRLGVSHNGHGCPHAPFLPRGLPCHRRQVRMRSLFACVYLPVDLFKVEGSGTVAMLTGGITILLRPDTPPKLWVVLRV